MNVVDENHVFFVDLPSVALKLNSVCFRLTPLPFPDPADDQDGKSGADDEAENAGDGCDVPESDLDVMEVACFRFVVIFSWEGSSLKTVTFYLLWSKLFG